MHSGVFWENCLGVFSGHSCIVCSITFCILDFSVDVVVNAAWILGTNTSHKRTNWNFPKVSHCCCYFCRSFVFVFFFLVLLLLLFPVSAFFLEEESITSQEIFFGVPAFPLTNKNCSYETSQTILWWQKVCGAYIEVVYTRTGVRRRCSQ